ncbi:glutathione peroxidase (plasmid) [Mucilaginibacter sp. PAMB04274]|uniref:glutathione peroxidase n=1 Tax=Mucilaginibacter sp. PAMB04274 TaxID=3138568 RepID=UPI0031F6800E
MGSFKQKIARYLYPLILRLGRNGKNGTVLINERKIPAKKPFPLDQVTLINGSKPDILSYSGKMILIVNTASNCGYTGQYAELQTLHEKFSQNLVIVGFPSNDFKEQEKANDQEIAQFCQINYGVTFPIVKKTTVIKNNGQHPVYEWLTKSTLNGWNDHAPDWNFGKYLIDDKGNLTHYFGPSISPLDHVFVNAIDLKK